jgi:amidase
MRLILAVASTALLGACAMVPQGGVAVSRDQVEERSIAELSRALAAGETSSEALVSAYLKRIERIDRAGPRLNSVIAINPDALAQARDADRNGHRARGPLHGVPILIISKRATGCRRPRAAWR